MEPKSDGKIFNNMQSTQGQEKAPIQLFGDKAHEAAGGKQQEGCSR